MARLVRPPDPQVDLAEASLRRFFEPEHKLVYYGRRLEVAVEAEHFHWVTNRALGQMRRRREIVHEVAEAGHNKVNL